ncbi:MAG TPA: molybdopterin-dependent oxidoreductase, partial [Chloroflexota bacterium]|nr:molybdopterin-dependent oxidoreductase [Chloroflexota bacterium]
AAATPSAAELTGQPATVPGAAAGAPPPVTPAVTSAAKFYLVSKNLADPVLQAEEWQLSVQGLVQRPLTLRYAQLTALPATEEYTTFECISNDVGGDLMSTGLWRGVPLATLLAQAGADTGQPYVLFGAADGYTESLPMAEALKPTTLVAYALDGAPLPPAHGFPARMVMLGHYGMKQPKWLTRISVSKTQEGGFWEQQGWDPQAPVRTTARIDAPKDGGSAPLGPVAFSGVAFAGDRGISAVQLSFDDGASWQDTRLQPALGAGVWNLWSYAWQPPKAGVYKVQARATDGTGAVQDARGADSFPSGASGYHRIAVRVR